MIKSLLKLVLLACSTVALCAVPAHAAGFGYVGTGVFGAAGSGPGEFADSSDIAVHGATGHVFVADSGNGRVQVLAGAAGAATYLTELAAGLVDTPYGVAVDQASGNLYVSDTGESRILRFTSDGAPTPTYTLDPGFVSPKAGAGPGRLATFKVRLAVDPTNGDVLVADSVNKRISRYDDTGSFQASYAGADIPDGALTGPIDTAVDPTGKLLIVDATGDVAEGGASSRALRLNADGSYDTTFDVTGPGAIAFDTHKGTTVILGGAGAFSGKSIRAFAGTTLAANTPLPGDSSGTVTGIVFDPGASEQGYALGDAVFGDCCGFVGVNILTAVDGPDVTIATPTAVTSSGAHFEGTINPGGRQTDWGFETSRDGGTSWSAVGSSQDAGSGSTAVDVTADASNLAPNIEYQVRLVATGAGGVATRSAPETFQTAGTAPTVVPVPAEDGTETSVKLGALVNARNAATTYRVEYGPTAAYGSATPIANAPAEGVTRKRLVTVSGLQQGTTYHYRLVAESSAGQTVTPDQTFTTSAPGAGPVVCANDAIRKQQSTTTLDGCRAFEMVSPADKNGGVVQYSPGVILGLTGSSTDGTKLTFNSHASIADARGGVVANYLSQRTPTGWTTKNYQPSPKLPNPSLSSRLKLRWWADDFSLAIFDGNEPGVPEDTTINDFSGMDVYLKREDGPLEAISRPDAGPFTGTHGSQFAAMSQDGSHVLFSNELDDDLAPGGDAHAAGTQLYDRTGGRTHLVGVGDDGQALSPCGASLAEQSNSYNRAMSEDGRRIIFTVPGKAYFAYDPSCDAPHRIYLRTDHAHTVEVSRSRRSTPDPIGRQPAYFGGASADGTIIYIMSSERLTDSATEGGGVYVYRVADDTLTFIVGVDIRRSFSIGPVLRVSEDGERAYIASSPPSVAEAVGEDVGNTNVYLYDHGTLRYISEIDGSVAVNEGLRPVRINDDGSVMAFASRLNVTSFDSQDTWQVYVYDTRSNELRCVSCSSSRLPASLPSIAQFPDRATPLSRNVASDGSVFFSTAAALVAQDTNGKSDVYRYRDGVLSLISDGRSPNGARFVDASVDGRHVFVATTDSLVAADVDGGDNDIYDAAVEGGFPEPTPPTKDPCSGDRCQGPAVPAQAQAPAESDKQRAGDAPATPRARLTLVAPSAAAKRTASRSGRLVLRAIVTAPGTIGVVLSAPVQGQKRSVGTTRRTVKKAGSYAMVVQLSQAARRELVRRGRLVVTAQGTATSVGRPVRTQITLNAGARVRTETGGTR
jgi:NHL repeat-containing protein